MARARALLDLGRARAAAREVQQALAQDPGHAEALQLYGLCLLRAGDFADAREALRSAVAAAPTEAHAHYLLGYCERELKDEGHEDKAEAGYREALRLQSEEPVYLRALAELLAGRKRFEEALRLSRLAVEVAPERASNHVTLGFVASASGDRALAKRAYEEALRLDPNDAVAWNNLGCVDLAQGRPMQARARFHEALRLNPEGKLAKDNIKLVAPPQRPLGIYREWDAFERQLYTELCDGVLLKAGSGEIGGDGKTGPTRRRSGREVHVLALLLATRGRALGVVARRAPRSLLLMGLGSASMLRLLRGGPVGVAALLGSGAVAYWISRERVAELRQRYDGLLVHTRAEYDRLQGDWLRGALHRRERDQALDVLLDRFCREIEEG